MPFSRPTRRRSTPIATTALQFSVRLDEDGVMELTLWSHWGFWALFSPTSTGLYRMLDTDLGQLTCPRTRVNGDQRASERAMRMAVTVSSGASKGTKCPTPGTNRKSRSGKVCSIPSAQAAGLTGSRSPHLTTVGRGIGSLVAQAEVSVSSSYVARYQPKLALRAPGRAKASTIASNSSGRTLSLLPTQ